MYINFESFLIQSNNTKKLHDEISKIFSDSYFDWKIIFLYYSVLQKIKSFLYYNGFNEDIDNHVILKDIINPEVKLKKYDLFKIDYKIYEKYTSLERFSRNARYYGYDEKIELVLKKNYELCIDYHKKINEYFDNLIN